MKITKVTATAESRRRPNPIRDALQSLDTEGMCRVVVETSEGVSGRSTISFGRGDRTPDILAHLINEELAPAVVGKDAFLIRAIRDKLWKLTDYHGTLGLALFGIAGIDIALWDTVGQALGQPVWRLLGAQRDRVPAYAMVGWLNYDVDTLLHRGRATGSGANGRACRGCARRPSLPSRHTAPCRFVQDSAPSARTSRRQMWCCTA